MVIATFSKPAAIFIAILGIVIGLGAVAGTLRPPSWSPYYGRPLSLNDYIILSIAPFIFISSGRILYELIFKRGRAIWLDGDNLICVDTHWYFGSKRINRRDINSVDFGTVGLLKFKTIDFNTAGGRQYIRLWPLSDNAETLLARLKACLS